MSKNEVISFLTDAIETLTWEKLAMAVILCIFAILTIFGFENRAALVDKILTPQLKLDVVETWELSPVSKKDLEKLVDTQQLISGVMVWDVDLKKNRATTIFMHPRAELLQMFTAELVLPQAFFGNEPKSRAQMVLVVSNSFSCAPTTDVSFVKPMNTVKKQLPTTACFLAVPPYTGGFVGFVGLILNRDPSDQEKDALRIELTRIAINIYLRDVENQSRTKHKNSGTAGSILR